MSTAIKKQVHEQKPEKVKKSWNCEQCEMKFLSKYGYDRRMKVHKATTTDVENLVKKVKSKAGFGTFLRTEKVKVRKEYLCHECTKTFNSFANLKMHILSGLHVKARKKKPRHRTTVMRKVD